MYLLLNDAVREKHKKEFEKWIQGTEARDAASLSLRAYTVIEGMADRLAAGEPAKPATSSVLAAHAMIWDVKKGSAGK